MNEDVSSEKLYSILNQAISKSSGCFFSPINEEANVFQQKYLERKRSNPQMDIFEPSLHEVNDIVKLCNNLELYRQSTDVYNDDPDPLPENTSRQLYEGLGKYNFCLSEENKKMCEVLRKSLRRRLPEYRDKEKIIDLDKDACQINFLRKKEKNKKKRDQSYRMSDDYQKLAVVFFESLLTSEVKSIQACPEKIKLYQDSLEIVDCLPSLKYGRAMKFSIKRDINIEIEKIASELGNEYEEIRKDARNNIKVYNKAINNVYNHITRQEDFDWRCQ